MHIAMDSDKGFKIALEEAKKGAAEGGVPIGACLVAADGEILGRGHNLRIQKGSPTIHVRRQAACTRNHPDRMYRQRLQLWKMQAGCLLQGTRELQCTPPCRLVICAPVLAFCTKSSEWYLERTRPLSAERIT